MQLQQPEGRDGDEVLLVVGSLRDRLPGRARESAGLGRIDDRPGALLEQTPLHEVLTELEDRLVGDDPPPGGLDLPLDAEEPREERADLGRQADHQRGDLGLRERVRVSTRRVEERQPRRVAGAEEGLEALQKARQAGRRVQILPGEAGLAELQGLGRRGPGGRAG